jgi:hypothetical protein
VIIVMGRPSIEDGPIGPLPAGMGAIVAMAIAAAGGRVELVGTLGDDASGDAVAIALSRAGVGHAALLRIPGTTTPRGGTTDAPTRLDAADVELGLRYLTDYRVLIVADTVPTDVLTSLSMPPRMPGRARDRRRTRRAADRRGRFGGDRPRGARRGAGPFRGRRRRLRARPRGRHGSRPRPPERGRGGGLGAGRLTRPISSVARPDA